MDNLDRSQLLERIDKLERELEDCRRRLERTPEDGEQDCTKWEKDSNLLQAIISALHDTIIFGIDRDGTFQFAWADIALRTRYGFDARELFAKGLTKVFPPEAVAKRIEVLKRICKTGEPFREEYPMRLPTGEFWHDVTLAPVRDTKGEITSVIGIVRDVTEMKRAENLLRESEERYRGVVDQVGDLIVIHRKGTFLFANKAAVNAMGLQNADELIGKSYLEVLHAESRDLIQDRIARIEDGADVIPLMEETFTIADGSKAVGEIVSRKISYQGGPAVLVVIRDVTDRVREEERRRQLEDRIRNAEKFSSLGMMAGGVAHDYNNLLIGVLGNADLLLQEIPRESPYLEKIRNIEKAAVHAAELTRQLQTYSGGNEFFSRPTDMEELIRGMSNLVTASVSKRVKVAFDFAGDLPPVEADATQLRQVVMNLLLNASEAIGKRKGQVVVRTRLVQADRGLLDSTYLQSDLAEGDYVSLEVVDDGPGMDQDTRSRVFDPFFSTKKTGRGLGLAVVLSIVRRHGGALRVDSSPERGTTFQLLFPLSNRRQDDVPNGGDSKTRQRDWMGSGLVMVVDDEEHVRSVASAALKGAGFQVEIASGGSEALRQFEKRPGDFVAVLLDMTMPDMSGDQVLRKLRSIRGDIPVILSSGYARSKVMDSIAQEEIGGFIHKPYRSAELLEKLRLTLTRKG